MRKMIPYYVVYIILCVFLLSNWGIAIAGSIMSKVLVGVATGGLVGVMLVTLNSDKQKTLTAEPAVELIATEKKETLHDWAIHFTSLFWDRGRVADMLRDEVEDALNVANLLTETLTDIRKLLSSNFSENDLTYTVYKEAIDDIEKTCCANFASIDRRLLVFKQEWDGSHALASKYEQEIQTFIKYNKEIGSKMEELTYELVCLSDNVQQSDADKITDLIRQVQNYVNVRQEM